VRLLKAVDALGERAATAAVTGEGWTAKDVLAHLIHWATQVAFGLGAQVQPPVYMMEERERRKLSGLGDAMPSGEESNALAVAYFRECGFDDVRAAFEHVVNAVVERVGARTNDEINATDAIPWAGSRPLWEFIGGDTFLHWPLHAEAIERAMLSDPEE
jgi:Mycothiol maleylpyruvate isomerase N-terminal domain